MSTDKREIIDLMEEIRDDVDFESEYELLDSCILDSVDIMQTVALIEDRYSITIPAKDVNPGNFNSVDSIVRLIHSIKKGDA